MAGALAHVKEEWQLFKHDPPGKRFCNHRGRMMHRSRKAKAIALAVGLALLASGFILLFIPGPGLLVIFFGLGLLAAQSPRLARQLDRTELWARRTGRRTRRRWDEMSGTAKIGLLVGIGVVAGAAMMVMWKYVVSTYVLDLLH